MDDLKITNRKTCKNFTQSSLTHLQLILKQFIKELENEKINIKNDDISLQISSEFDKNGETLYDIILVINNLENKNKDEIYKKINKKLEQITEKEEINEYKKQYEIENRLYKTKMKRKNEKENEEAMLKELEEEAKTSEEKKKKLELTLKIMGYMKEQRKIIQNEKCENNTNDLYYDRVKEIRLQKQEELDKKTQGFFSKDSIAFNIDEYFYQKFKIFYIPYWISKEFNENEATLDSNIKDILLIVFKFTKNNNNEFIIDPKYYDYLKSIDKLLLSKFRMVVLLGSYPCSYEDEYENLIQNDFNSKINNNLKEFYNEISSVTSCKLQTTDQFFMYRDRLGMEISPLSCFVINNDEDKEFRQYKGFIRKTINKNINEIIKEIDYSENDLTIGNYDIQENPNNEYISKIREVFSKANYMTYYSYILDKTVKLINDKIIITGFPNLKINGFLYTNEYNELMKIKNEIEDKNNNKNNNNNNNNNNNINININVKEIKTFNINLPSEIKCIECNKIIPEGEGIYYCYKCHIKKNKEIFYCIKCVEDKFNNPNNKNKELFIHPEHNLIHFITRNKKYLYDLPLDRLGEDKFYQIMMDPNQCNDNEKITYIKHECNFVCDICDGEKESSVRFICLSCIPGTPVEKRCYDVCYNCIKELRNNKDFVGKQGEEIIKINCFDNKIKFELGHRHQTHVYLMLIACVNDYYNF